MILEIVLTILLGWLSYTMYHYIGHVMKLKDYPPGPFPLPIIGNLHLMGLKPYEIFRDMAKKYGDVFSISLGMQRVVIVNSIDPAREALITKGHLFAGRPNNHYTADLISRGYKDIAFTDYGPLWQLTRKLGHAALKMFGDGLGNLETKVVSECEELRIRLQKNLGKPVDVTYEYGLAVQNVICSMVFGTRYHRDDPEFLDMLKVGNLLSSGFSNGDPVAFLPWLRFYPFEGLRKIKEAISIRDPLYTKKLKEHRDTFDPEHVRDFTDSLLKSTMDEGLWKNVGLKEVTDDHLEMIINDVFIAGAETTTTTLRWLTTYLLHWPHFQEEIFAEIIQVVGVDRYPELKDRPKMPLLQAALQESLRLSSLVPLGVPHKAMEDSSIGGRNVPKVLKFYSIYGTSITTLPNGTNLKSSTHTDGWMEKESTLQGNTKVSFRFLREGVFVWENRWQKQNCF